MVVAREQHSASLLPDGHVLIAGGLTPGSFAATAELYTPDPPADLAGFVRPHMEAVFPRLKGRRIDYAWGGLVSITRTRLPHIGREGEVLFAHGYSGLGVVLSTLAGKLLVEEILGRRERFELFATLEPPPFPGGVGLRGIGRRDSIAPGISAVR